MIICMTVFLSLALVAQAAVSFLLPYHAFQLCAKNFWDASPSACVLLAVRSDLSSAVIGPIFYLN
jgi:hypothetical protein